MNVSRTEENEPVFLEETCELFFWFTLMFNNISCLSNHCNSQWQHNWQNKKIQETHSNFWFESWQAQMCHFWAKAVLLSVTGGGKNCILHLHRCSGWIRVVEKQGTPAKSNHKGGKLCQSLHPLKKPLYVSCSKKMRRRTLSCNKHRSLVWSRRCSWSDRISWHRV